MEQSKYHHSDKLPLSLVVKELEKDIELTGKALHILSVEDKESTYTTATAVSALINLWLVNRDLNCYINGKLVDDVAALTVHPVAGDYNKGLEALENWMTIRKDELAALLKQRNLTVPPFLRPSVQLSKAPPPITPLHGGSYIPRQDTNDRLPRWSKWRLMPEVKEWEAIALSLNIEPDKIKTDRNAWMGARHPFDEGEEFNDRLEILNKHSSNRTYFPTPCILNMANWYQCEVRLDEFAAWCIHVGFDIPPELAALAKDTPSEKGFDYWLGLKLWPLDAACRLVCSADPNNPDQAPILMPNPATRPAWVNLFHQATADNESPPIENGKAGAKGVNPAAFIEWARKYECGLDEKFNLLLDNSNHAARVEAAPADNHDETLALLFDNVPVAALEKMFPADGKWERWAEKAKANGLIIAREKTARFNPYKAGLWFVNKGATGWDIARLYRTLANNLPARSLDNKHLLTGVIE